MAAATGAMLLLAASAAAGVELPVRATPAPTGAVYVCLTEGGCTVAPAGTPGAMKKATCDSTCHKDPTPPPPATPPPASVYACDSSTSPPTCIEASPGSPGSTSKANCDKNCGHGTPAPVPPTPAAKVYKCDAATGSCDEVPPGTQGSSSKAVCEQYCGVAPGPPPDAKYKCDTVIGRCNEDAAGTQSHDACLNSCQRTPQTPPPTPPVPPSPTPPPVPGPPVPVPPGSGYYCDEFKSWQCLSGGNSSQGACELSCVKPNDVYLCHNASSPAAQCTVAPPFTPGSTDLKTCEAQCSICPHPPCDSTPAPLAVVYGCDETTWSCHAVAPYTPGSGPLDLCNKKCNNPAPAPAPPAPAPAPKRNCTHHLDLLFVVDGSGSINARDWRIDLDVVGSIAGSFSFGARSSGTEAEMGIIQFSTATKVEQPFTADENQFFRTLSAIEEEARYTYTGDAMETAAGMMAGAPAADYRAVVLITDGVPCTPASALTCDRETAPVPDPAQTGKAESQAAALKASGVEILSIAVGNFEGPGIEFIKQISSSPPSKYVYNPTTWDDLQKYLQQIIDSICPH